MHQSGIEDELISNYRIYFKNHGKYKSYRNILTESPINLILLHLEHPRLTG